MSADLPRLLVLYGSETGTAEDVALSVRQQALDRALPDAQAAALDAFPVARLLPACRVVVFVVATTGDGEPPDNMRAAWRALLRRSLPPDWLAGVRFAVFGLGDSGYAKYNAVARKLQARLLQLGGTEIVERGLGDDQHPFGYFGALNPWLNKLWTAVLCEYPLPEGFVVDDKPKPVQPKFVVTTHGAESEQAQRAKAFSPRDAQQQGQFYAPPRSAVNAAAGIYMAPLVVNRRITADDWTQDVRHIEFDLSEYRNMEQESAPLYRAGDIAVVYPENTTGVDEMLQYVGLSGDTVVSIESTDGSEQLDIPSPTTVCDVFAKYLAILEIPRRSFFEKLSLYATDEEEKEKLEELCSPEGVDLLYDYCIREKKTYAEVLVDFPSVKVPLNVLLQLIPRQKPRSYSISSSALLHPGRVHLTVAIVDFLTPYKRRRHGICSSFFTSIDPEKETRPLAMWIKRGLFELPPLDQDMILIGPGTGLASMRAILQERQFLRAQASPNESTGETITGNAYLYFGCRHENKDFLYGDELRHLVASGDLTELHTAFSRDQDHKVYVQTRLAENKDAVCALLLGGVHVYLAGSAKRVPADVRETLRDILRAAGKLSLEAAEKVLKALERNKRYIVESWS